jgi:hypothetical protein
VTHLRQAMLDELQRRNYAKTTVQYYIQAVERFAKHFQAVTAQRELKDLSAVAFAFSSVPGARRSSASTLRGSCARRAG